MKLKNKKTGEIIEVESLDVDTPTEGIVGFPSFDRKGSYNSLAELNEEWEDYEEPKEIYFISNNGQIHEEDGHDRYRETRKQIGNYFETEEEAEKAVEKLKAWKRLKDKGFRFDGFYDKSKQHILWHCGLPYITDDEFYKDLDLLFGGEE